MDLYQEIIDVLNIYNGERLWISSDVIGIIMGWRKYGIKFDGNQLIDCFQKAVGPEGTLLIPTFCYDFSNKGFYDYLNSKCCTGAIGNLALKRDDFIRTQHPMHSFAVWGKDSQMLFNMTNKHAFGDDSPLAYCLSHDVRQIILNTDYASSLTFVHYAETKCGVPYRFEKKFTGTYINGEGIASVREYDYAARKLEWDPVEKINRLGEILEKNNIAKTYYIREIPYHTVDLSKSFPVICDDINHNQCRSIYDFSIERETIFAGWNTNFDL